MSIKVGQVYKVPKDFYEFGIYFKMGDILNVVGVSKNLILIECPDSDRYTNNLDSNGNLPWHPPFFEQTVRDSFFELLPGVVYTPKGAHAEDKPTRNSTNEICNMCGKPTEPFIGRQRICRECEK
jgi:hypothetical protein